MVGPKEGFPVGALAVGLKEGFPVDALAVGLKEGTPRNEEGAALGGVVGTAEEVIVILLGPVVDLPLAEGIDDGALVGLPEGTYDGTVIGLPEGTDDGTLVGLPEGTDEVLQLEP